MEDKISLLSKLYYNPRTGLSSVADLIRTASEYNVGLSAKEIRNWYRNQDVNQVFRPVVRNKHEFIPIQSPTNTTGTVQVDLMDITPKYKRKNKGYRYILNFVDVASRYAWSFPIKNKTPTIILPYVKQVFNEIGPQASYRSLTSDDGSEFKGVVKQWLKEQNIDQFMTTNKTSTAIVERFNRTLWMRLRKLRSLNFVDSLDDIVYKYNRTKHTGINNEKPIEIFNGTIEPPPKKPIPPTANEFNVNDRVRYVTGKDVFAKATLKENYSNKIYIVDGKTKHRYLIKANARSSPLKRTFLARELMKVDGKTEAEPKTTEFESERDSANRQGRFQRLQQREFDNVDEDTGEVKIAPQLQPNKPKREKKDTKKFKFSKFDKLKPLPPLPAFTPKPKPLPPLPPFTQKKN